LIFLRILRLAAAAALACAAPVLADAGAPLSLAGFAAEDTTFAQPYIDSDEVRGGPDGQRYVHGGFTGTDTRFAFHFPPADTYRQRFFQYITPVPDSETVSQGRTGAEDRIGAALAAGAIFVETNGGGPDAARATIGQDQSIGAYRANAAAARLVRHLAQQVYGSHRTYGFAYGGSGGAYRTIGSLENTTGVWDGAVPYVVGSPMAIPNMFTVRLQTMRVLGPKLDAVVDALDAGGSGDPAASLDAQQRAALAEVTRMGFPPQSWYAWRTMGPHAFALLFGAIRMADPAYFTDFWALPGYAGHDRPELYKQDRVRLDTRIAAVITAAEAEAMGLDIGRQAGQAKGTADKAWQAMGLKSAGEAPAAFRLADTPRPGALLLADLVLPDGRKLNLRDVHGDIAVAGINDPRLLTAIKVGDAVALDNSDILAVQSYHRHQVPPGGQYPVWDQFRGADGKPLYPQRPLLLGPMFTRNASGLVPTGKFAGKMILLESLWDREALPWQGDWYRQRVQENLGAKTDDSFRIWMTDRALHGDTMKLDDPSRVVPYLGVLDQALRDLADWVQHGVAPPASTRYEVRDGQVVVPASAAARGGIQPVVTMAQGAAAPVQARAGRAVRLSARIALPPGAGSIVAAEWDFDGDGVFDETIVPAGKPSRLTVSTRHVYATPGTRFAVLRVAAQRQGDKTTPHARVLNLARARIVVR